MESNEPGTEPGEQEGRGGVPPVPEDSRSRVGDGDAAPAASEERPAADSEERNPAADQAPVATEAQDTIIGDPGIRDEQVPQGSVGSQDVPVRTSAPPPSAQSGVPLPEDRAAGVEPDREAPQAVEGNPRPDESEPDASED